MAASKVSVEVGPVSFDSPQDGSVLQSIGLESVFRVACFLGETEVGHGSSFILNHEMTKDGIKLWCLTNLHVVRGVLDLYHRFSSYLYNGAPEKVITELPAGLRIHVGEGTIIIESILVPKSEFFKLKFEPHLDFAIFSFTVPADRKTRYFPIAQKSQIIAGTKAYAIGYPKMMNLAITDGLVSRIYEDGDGDSERAAGAKIYFWKWGIQHNIFINPGNSGGPTLNEFGKVIGIATYGYSDGLEFSLNARSILNHINDPLNLEEIFIPSVVKMLALRAIESARYG